MVSSSNVVVDFHQLQTLILLLIETLLRLLYMWESVHLNFIFVSASLRLHDTLTAVFGVGWPRSCVRQGYV